jgi:hypothetical protein
MTLRREFSLGHSEFNDFLFALVGQENNGCDLTVLSALTRLGVDPWREASRLSALPKDMASQALAVTIGLLPQGDWSASEAWPTAVRLIDLLPKRGVPKILPAQSEPRWRAVMRAKPMLWWIAALAALLLFALSLL